MAIEFNITLDAHLFPGEDKIFPITVYESDTSTTPEDITDWEFSWVVKRRKKDRTALVTKTTGAGIDITNGAEGLLVITLTRAESALLKGGVLHHYELRRTDEGFNGVVSKGIVHPNRSLE